MRAARAAQKKAKEGVAVDVVAYTTLRMSRAVLPPYSRATELSRYHRQIFSFFSNISLLYLDESVDILLAAQLLKLPSDLKD